MTDRLQNDLLDQEDELSEELNVKQQTKSPMGKTVASVSPAVPSPRMEEIRSRLYEKAEEDPAIFYLQERILSMELMDECSQVFYSYSRTPSGQLSSQMMEATALVRMVEAYYIGHGTITPLPERQSSILPTAVHPFGSTATLQDKNLPPTKEAIVEVMNEYRRLFENANSGLMFFRAFGFALHCYQQRDQKAMLDAYCTLLYTIKVLQGDVHEFHTVEFGTLIEYDLTAYKSEDVDMTADDLLWNCCILFLQIGSLLRIHSGHEVLNTMLPPPFGLAMDEELNVAQLAMEIRSESPVSFLSAYRNAIEWKPVIPPNSRGEWMTSAYEFAVYGLAAADRWGDPLFQFTFHMIVAYWLPTSTHAPSPFSYQELQERLRLANKSKEQCKDEVPKERFWFGEHHEACLQHLLDNSDMDRETELTRPLVDAYDYPEPTKATAAFDETSHSCKPFERTLHCPQCGSVYQVHSPKQATEWKESHCQVCSHQIHSQCSNCGETLTKKLSCAKCGITSYCNRKCQLDHWKNGHKQECKRMAGKKVPK